MNIAHVGTFDVENFGDLLFPLLAQKRMRRFDPDVKFTFVSPTSSTPVWADSVSTIAFDDFIAGSPPDGLLVGGGNIIRANRSDLGAYDTALTPLLAYANLWAGISARFLHSRTPIFWNAVGVPVALPRHLNPELSSWLKRVDYLSVRDDDSRQLLLDAESSLDVSVVPDTAWEVCDLWSRQELQDAYFNMFQSRQRVPSERILSVHLNDRYLRNIDHQHLGQRIDALCSSLNCTPVLLAMAPCHGDDELARSVSKHLSAETIVIDKPASLREITAAIAHSTAYLGSSMHGFIAASSFGVPATMIASPKMIKFSGLLASIDRKACLFEDWLSALDSAPDFIKTFDATKAHALRSGLVEKLDTHWGRITDRLSVKGDRLIDDLAEAKKSLRDFRVRTIAAAPTATLADLAARLLASSKETAPSRQHLAAEKELREKLLAADVENTRLKQREQTTRQELRALHQKLGEARRINEQFVNSTTWRATAPIRYAGVRLPRPVRTFIRAGVKGVSWLSEPHLLPRRLQHVRFRLQAGLGVGDWLRRNSVDEAPTETIRGNVDAPPRDVAIIVPIYNAVEELEACVTSVLRHTDRSVRLILVDDASPDPRIRALLVGLKTIPNVSVIENATNRGFTRTVNRGIAFAGSRDVVLLNSDTCVTPNWLSKLRRAAYSDSRVATATPFSDNAGAFSAPIIGQKNPIPVPPGLDGYARLVERHSGRIYPAVPTGNGYCIYIKRLCLDDVGVLDGDAFPRGYGEENDFCMRSVRAGWKHVIDDTTIIHHVRSASFGEAKTDLMKAGRSVVDKRYPEYSEAIQVFTKGTDIDQARKNVAVAAAAASESTSVKPRLLFVVSTRTGGTPQTNQDLMGALSDRYETYLLRCDSRRIEFSHCVGSDIKLVKQHTLKASIKAFPHTSDEYDQVVQCLIEDFGIDLLHVRHIAWHSLNLTKIARRVGIPAVFSFHDFYTICPTVKLLDENGIYCKGTCTKSFGECSHELWRHDDFPPLKHNAIEDWQSMFQSALADCDAFVTTSVGAKKQIEQIYPFIGDRIFEVIPHGRDLKMQRLAGARNDFGEKLRILVPGNIDAAKGAHLIEALAKLDQGQKLEFHVLGYTAIRSGPGLIVHPPYKREEFDRIVAGIKPHIGAIFSIWPETFCHTLTEMWAAGLPVAAIDLGAVGERLHETGCGWTHPLEKAGDIYEWLLSIAQDADGVTAATERVSMWQQGSGSEKTSYWMSQQYEALYDRLLDRRAALLPASQSNLQDSGRDDIVLVPSYWNSRSIAGTGWVRLLNPYRRMGGLQSRTEPADQLPLPGSARAAILQRDANRFTLAELQDWTTAWRSNGGKLIYDVDDDLLDIVALRSRVSENPDDIAIKSRWLASQADLVTASTIPLMERYRPLSKGIAVVPNFLEPDLWRLGKSEMRSGDLRHDCIRIGYVGTPTHGSDLLIVKKAMQQVQKTFGPKVEIEVIGGFQNGPTLFGKRVPLPSENEYPEFVEWLHRAADWDIGIIPLEENEFNASKSNLKFQEYSALGLSIVCSDVASYRDVADNLTNCLAVPNSTEAWHEAVSKLVTDKELRRSLSQRALEEATQSHSIDANLDRYECVRRVIASCP